MTYLRKDIKRGSSYLGKISTSQTITDCRWGIKRIAHSDKLEKPYTACFFQVYLIMYEGGTKIFSTKGISSSYLICSLTLIVSLNKDLDLVIVHPHRGSSFTIPGRVGI